MREYNTNPSVANPDIHYAGVQYERNPGAEFGDHIKNTAAVCNTSAAHTYGNVLSVVEKYILDLFPKDLFKTVTATTTLASRQLRHTPSQIVKMEMPSMVLAPRISFGQDDNRFLANTIINSRITNTFNTWGESSLIPLANDKYNRIHVHGHYNRAVMYIDVVLGFHTFMEQTNWMSFIHNMIPIGHNFFIKAPLELYIPDEFNALLSNLAGVPVNDQDENSVYKYLTYMNSIWYHPITYKLKGGSNSDEFFMYYLSDIDTVVQEPVANQGIKDGQIRRNFDIAFTVRCEFNTIGYFMLNAPELKENVNITCPADKAIVPIFTDTIALDDFHLPVGWSILGFPIFKLAQNENTISINEILNNSLRTVLDYHLKLGIPIDRFIQFQFRENGAIVNSESFYIDWNERILHILNPNPHKTYRLLITVSHDYINEMIKRIYDFE
jgi:hypothetical protein